VGQLARTQWKTRPRGDRRKAEIIQTATDVFSRQGYGRASLASVASGVGITEPGLLHHFPSKEELLLAVLKERDHDDGRRLFGAASQDGLRMLDGLKSLVAHNLTVPGLAQLYTVLVAESLAGDQPGRDFFVERYAKMRRWMTQSFEAGQAQGEIGADGDVDAIVPVLIAVMDGLQLQWLLDPAAIDMAAAFDAFASMVGQCLRSTNSGGPGTTGSDPRR